MYDFSAFLILNFEFLIFFLRISKKSSTFAAQ